MTGDLQYLINDGQRSCLSAAAARPERQSGVGKTALLENLNNKLSDSRHIFDLVILVKASAGVMNIETIQKVMRYRLAISKDVWDDKIEQSREQQKFPGG